MEIGIQHMKEQLEIIKEQFTKQAPAFNAYQETDKKKAFNQNVIEQMKLSGKENVLEVAAGTCSLGRMLVPHSAHITELDATQAMLDIGRAENEKAGVFNADYVIGTAEKLPFSDSSFDAVVSRLAFHHFEDTSRVFDEMCRVLKEDGILVIADMLARKEPCRDNADNYERLRDSSHVRCLTEAEFDRLAEKHSLEHVHSSITAIPMNLNAWLDLTGTSDQIRQHITEAMLRDIKNIDKNETGFSPYQKDGEIMFEHKWLLLIYRKKTVI